MSRMAGPLSLEVGGRRLSVTHPDKVVFPEPGLTKLDLIRYYLAVADGALRGVAGRPMILKRFVKGIDAGGVLPEARAREAARLDRGRRAAATRSGTSAKEAVIHDAAGLAWVVNLGCVDLNPHPVRPRTSTTPTSCGSTSTRCRASTGADRRRRAGRPRGARRPRADRVAEDVGLARLPHLRAHRSRTGRISTCGWPPRPSPARSSAARRTSPPPVVEGGARRACSSTSTRTPRTAPSPRRTRCGPCPTPGCRRRCTGTRCADCRPGGVHGADRARPLRRDRRPVGRHRRRAGALDALLDLADRARPRRRRRRKGAKQGPAGGSR